VRDPATADDLVQDTWCAALRTPPVNVANERGWLAALLSNLVRARARNEGARERREHAVASGESIEGPDDLVERAEAQRHLLGHVLALDEPYRTTLLARYVEGRAGPEIARREGVNESTVRTRLQRAHERLRERLKREHRDGGLMALAPLLGGAFEPSVHVAWATAVKSATAATGVVIVSTTSKVLLAAGLVVCAWLAWDRAVDHEPAPPPLSSEVAATVPLEPTESASSEREPVVPQRESIETAPVAPKSVPKAVAPVVKNDATLDVVFTRDRVPLPGIAVWIAPRDEWPIADALDLRAALPATARTMRTNGEGVAAFRELKRSPYTLGFDVAGTSPRPTRFTTIELHAGHRYEIALGSAAIRGRVYDERGRPRVGVGIQVCYATPDAAWMVLAATTLTNELGDYFVGDLTKREYEVVMDPACRFDGRGNVEVKRVALAANEELVVDFGSFAPAPIWTGRVLNAFGEPFECSACRLRIDMDGGGDRITTPVAADGSFSVAFRPGTWHLTAFVPGCSDGGHVLGKIELPPTDLVRDVVVPGARLRGKITFEERAGGKPMTRERSISARPKGHDYPAAFRDVLVGAGGNYRIDGLEPGTWILSVYPGRFVEGETIEVTIAPTDTMVVLDLRLQGRR
jgi:RNA polymerase sigma-70 factor (ECF subfamily)